ncbi:MAG: hypothetical protein JWQ04_1543 [Pedosphaera sp.]|nr:hypothetical protein [Pedosphaera sp.]
MSATPEQAGSESTLSKFRWPLAVVLVVLLIVGGSVIAIRSCAKIPAESIHAFGQETEKILGKFGQSTITRTFEESLPQLSSEPGGRLELATLTLTESLSESNNLITGWGNLNLGSTVTEIKVPATYRYYLRLHDSWKLEVATNICVVHAPRIHPSLPPAIDTSRMEKKSTAGWGRFNANEQMDQLEKDITPTLGQYAGDATHLALVREECRKTVAQFVRDWLLKEQQWRDDRFTSIKVIFADEVGTNVFNLPPTLEYKGK